MKSLHLHSKKYKSLESGFGEWLQILGYGKSSCYYLPIHVHEFLCWLERKGITDLKTIKSTIMNQYLHYLQNRSNHKSDLYTGPLSSAYINKHLQALKNFSKYLRESHQGELLINLQVAKHKSKIGFIPSKGQIKALYAATSETLLGRRDRAMLAIYYGCGLRRTEGVELNVKDVLLYQNLLHIRKGKNYKERFVPISNGAKTHLESYLEVRDKFKPLPREKSLLLSSNGKRPDGQSLAIRLKKLAERAGISEKLSLHSLRHGIATHLLEAGMELQSISRFLGHSSLEATQIYTHPHAKLQGVS